MKGKAMRVDGALWERKSTPSIESLEDQYLGTKGRDYDVINRKE